MNKLINNIKAAAADIAKVAVPILLYGTCAYITRNTPQHESVVIYESNSMYGLAVKAIADSDMFSGSKQRAINSLNKDGSDEYYEAVIAIANSDDMLSGSKCEAISKL